MQLAHVSSLALALGLSGCWIVAGTPDFEAAGTGGAGATTTTTASTGESSSTGGQGTGGQGTGGGEPVNPQCVMMADDFETLEPQVWTAHYEGGQLEIVNNALHAFAAASNSAYITSVDPVDVRGCSIVAEVTPGPETGDAALGLFDNALVAEAYVVLRAGNLLMGNATGTEEIVGPYDSTQDHWWLLQHEQGDLILKTSWDGVHWHTRYAVTPNIDFASVNIKLGVYGDHGAADATFDNVTPAPQ